jgi:hypothetical protein
LERVRSKQGSAANAASTPTEPLTGSLVRFLSDCGVMKFAVDAAKQPVR